jgi:predicted RNase H-like HicB family nuclease
MAEDLEKDMKYRVNIQKTEEGYSVWCPGLPGCWSQGKTEDEAMENIKDAIKAYLKTVEELSKGQKPDTWKSENSRCQSFRE